MRENKEPNLDILTKALALKDSSRITEEHLELSIKIYNKRVVMALPVPNTEHVLPFTKLVGSERKNQ